MSKSDEVMRRLVLEGARVRGDFLILPGGKKRKINRTVGYRTCGVYGVSLRIGRFICWKYHGPPPPKHFADHINQIKHDDRPRNLRWVTVQENTLNCFGRGTFAFRRRRGSFDSKVSKAYGAAMRAKRKAAGLVLREVARRMDISAAYLCDLERGFRIFNPSIEKRFLAALRNEHAH